VVDLLSIETIITFISASVILCLAPGPDNIFVLTQSALRGWRVGVLTTLGLCTGLMMHTALVVFGVSVIFQTSPAAFQGLKILGACYLVLLAYRAIRRENVDIKPGENPTKSFYLTGVVMNLSNPKVAIFFLVFLPQFVSPDTSDVPSQMMLLGLIFILCALCVFSCIAYLSSFLKPLLMRSPVITSRLNYITALIFVALAFNLLLVN